MKRDGKLVLRPDSGDPVKIICGDPKAPNGSPENKGSIQLLWELFGGTLNSKGFKQLDPHVGLIYGDSITQERCKAILQGLEAKEFASTNVVFGIGSYTYQYNTRDTFGFAMKATYGEIEGKPCEIFKAPKTDDGVKNSAKGLLCVNEDMTLSQNCTKEQEAGGLLKTVFLDGKITAEQTLSEIRERLKNG
jgi:nicotinamide phosphoribosyltransferase